MTALVVGATGGVGRAVLAGLAGKGIDVRGMSRYEAKFDTFPAGAKGVVGDLVAFGSLGNAFSDVEAVFLVSPLSQNEIQMGRNAIKAAQAAGVKKIVYLSVPLPEGADRVPHFRNKILIEKALKESGIAYTILRANNFFQNDQWGQAAIMGYGTYPQPLGNIGLNRVDSRDVADAAVNALMSDGFENQEFAIHGPSVWTGESIAAEFSKQLGREIKYAGDDLDSWAKQAQHMMQAWMVNDFKIMYDFFQKQGLKATAEELAQQKTIVGHESRTFEAFVGALLKQWAD